MTPPNSLPTTKKTGSAVLVLLTCLTIGFVAVPQAARGVVVYETSFDSMTPDMPLSGQDGWLEFNGADSQKVEQYGHDTSNFAWVGDISPEGAGDVFVFHPVDEDPVASSKPVVRFLVNFFVNDSTNGNYDIFSWALYNQSAELLGSINLDLTDLKIFADDTVDYWDLEVNFGVESWYALDVLADFERNIWTAYLYDYETEEWTTLFTEELFHAGSSTLNLGDIDLIWIANDPSGDNRVLFDDYSIRMLNRREAWYAETFELFEDEIDAVKDLDDDGDGFSRDEEFAFGGDPNVADAAEMPVLASTNASGANSFLTVSFFRQTSNSLGFTYEVEESGMLNGAAWNTLPLPGNEVGITPFNDFWETVEVQGERKMTGPGAVPSGFLRVRIVPDP